MKQFKKKNFQPSEQRSPVTETRFLLVFIGETSVVGLELYVFCWASRIRTIKPK
jgi:hypothetical protein